LTIHDTKEYLESIATVFVELLVDRQVFLDFEKVLVEQNAKNNLFIYWCIRNYQKVTILNLCKILEPRKDDSRKRTLRYFVNFWKQPNSYELLKSHLEKATITSHNRHTGETHVIPIGNHLLSDLQKIDFESDITRIQAIHEELKTYRDTQLCHNDCREIDIVLPQIRKINGFSDELEKMIINYFYIFCRHGYVFDDLKRPQSYHNFNLHLD